MLAWNAANGKNFVVVFSYKPGKYVKGTVAWDSNIHREKINININKIK